MPDDDNRTRAPRNKRHAVISDVAREVGVSPTTVSHAFSGARPVNPETVAAIWEAADQLGYRPNRIASNLRKGTTGNIGFILPDISNLAYATFARAIQNEAQQADYFVLIRNVDDSLEEEKNAVRSLLLDRIVDGVILLSTFGPHDYLSPLIEQGHKIVILNRFLHDVVAPSVTADDERAAFHATNHLLKLGHTAIAAIASPEGYSPADLRIAGFRRALFDHGRNTGRVYRSRSFTGTTHRQEAFEITQQILQDSPRPTAIFAAAHHFMEGVVLALRESGVSCPDEVALLAFGNTWSAQLLDPITTVVELDAPRMAEAAVRLLLSWIAKGGPGESVVVPPRFCLGES
ncbi:MAG: LacI family DNA-binding transcriptional regulator, partial [Thermomicrobiales bacterium]|nr:LacI family DNA-binding transcriptional regulator [Thermomicrobiales bacterium]